MPITGSAPALMSARLGLVRLGASRLGVTPPIPVGTTFVTVGGVSARARVAGVTVSDVLNDAPNTASFTVEDVAPALGQIVRITTGDGSSTPAVLFAGTIETIEQVYEGAPPRLAWHVTCQDYTRSLRKRSVRKRYAQQSATAIALDLIANYSSGFTVVGVVAGLPTVTGGIDFTDEDLATCLTRLVARIGAYWYVDYGKDIHVFLAEATAAPDDLIPGSLLLNDPALTWVEDLTQIRTRVYVEGGGSKSRNFAAAGATVLPVTDAGWYSGSGGLVVSGPQRIVYTGKGLVGGPAAPSVASSLVVGTLGPGPYTYKVTQIDAGVETPLSVASASVSIAAVPNPTSAIGAAFSAVAAPVGTMGVNPSTGVLASTIAPGDSVNVRLTYVTSTGETVPGTTSATVTVLAYSPAPSFGQAVRVTGIPVPSDPLVTSKWLYVNVNGNWQRVSMANATTTIDVSYWSDNTPPPSTSTATAIAGSLTAGVYRWKVVFVSAQGETASNTGQNLTMPGPGGAALTSIPVSSDARVTSRRIFRTAVGGSTYKLETTIGNNTATTFTSTAADGALGATLVDVNVTAGGGKVSVTAIATGGGGVTARKLYRTLSGGATYKLVATIADNTTTTYTDNIADGSLGAVASGDTITQLTGIPASGAGSILNDILADDDVNVLAQCDDLTAQAALAAIDGSDGIVEHTIQDRRLSLAEATAVGNAELELFSAPILALHYATHDTKTRSGKTVHVALPSLDLLGDFIIQSVTITEIGVAAGLPPRYTVEASSVRFSIEDVLRRVRLE